ncbi:SDR family oxidoreductase [Robbsia andropogonis]|uniref:SDR family oxidoreductase n=1 Tax=Robbsia andropogonis TaxID=28092 RepID=UPI00046779AD|nr:SDR family oxidoreductase [Robbsia andropogonis]MCP1120858.1 SDR family oxidoreductase [Robbsia andropogonis]MCP1130680.1 SDR family oxidoreductase [Robbsia andropogonis]
MLTLIVTGASGALGMRFVRDWLRTHADWRIVAVFRSREAAEACLHALPAAMHSALTTLIADLNDPASLRAAAKTLPKIDRAVAVHLAADVAWDKTFDEMRALNVDGSLHFGDFVAQVARQPHFIYVSTAFTRTYDWIYRNGYEESKAAGERALHTRFASIMPVSVFSCSLVVGDSTNGAIGRFHGLYPLIRFIAALSPPFLVGNRAGRFDLVPIDWVVDELMQLVERCAAGAAAAEVVAAAGDARLPYERVIRIVESRIDLAREAAGLPALTPVPILRGRQWAFLKRSLAAWRPDGVSANDFRYFERLLQIYGVYAESETVRAPLNVTQDAPGAELFLPRAVDYWLSHSPDARSCLTRRAMANVVSTASTV